MSKRMSGMEWEMILDQLEKQTERIDKLETRIKDLENQKNTSPIFPNVPVQPRLDPISCSVCGIRFEGAMGYACMHPRCPSKVTCFTS